MRSNKHVFSLPPIACAIPVYAAARVRSRFAAMTPETLIAAIIAMVSGLPPDQARSHVEAAITVAAEHQLPVELVLGIAYVESRFDARALSRMECETADRASCTRKTGIWTKATKPPKARPSWYCGPMQSGGYVPWTTCQKMRSDVAYGYQTGAEGLVAWMNDKRCRRLGKDAQLRCALAGYNGGNAGVAAYRTHKYVNWVFLHRDRVVKFAAYAEQKQSKPGS
jgi:hypothetical protein